MAEFDYVTLLSLDRAEARRENINGKTHDSVLLVRWSHIPKAAIEDAADWLLTNRPRITSPTIENNTYDGIWVFDGLDDRYTGRFDKGGELAVRYALVHSIDSISDLDDLNYDVIKTREVVHPFGDATTGTADDISDSDAKITEMCAFSYRNIDITDFDTLDAITDGEWEAYLRGKVAEVDGDWLFSKKDFRKDDDRNVLNITIVLAYEWKNLEVENVQTLSSSSETRTKYELLDQADDTALTVSGWNQSAGTIIARDVTVNREGKFDKSITKIDSVPMVLDHADSDDDPIEFETRWGTGYLLKRRNSTETQLFADITTVENSGNLSVSVSPTINNDGTLDYVITGTPYAPTYGRPTQDANTDEIEYRYTFQLRDNETTDFTVDIFWASTRARAEAYMNADKDMHSKTPAGVELETAPPVGYKATTNSNMAGSEIRLYGAFYIAKRVRMSS